MQSNHTSVGVRQTLTTMRPIKNTARKLNDERTGRMIEMIERLKTIIKNHLENTMVEQHGANAELNVEEPKRAGQGDLSVPVFVLAKSMGKPLPEIADDVASIIKEGPAGQYIADVKIMGGFVNMHLSWPRVAEGIIRDFEHDIPVQADDERTIVIDYSSPNIAKPFSVGHLRSTIIGHAIGNIAERLGHHVVRINHLGDFGTQFGKIIYAYLHYGDEDKVKENPIEELMRLYVEFHEIAKEDPSVEDEARTIFRELESGNPRYQRIWEWFREVSLNEYMRIYDLLGVRFDAYDGEAFYNDKMKPVIEELNEKGLLKEDEGAMIVDLGEDMPPALIQKKDGSTLYITRDLAAIFYRKDTYGFDEALYVVGNEQKLHFEQLRRVITKMGYDFADQIEHVNFGLVLQDGKKMSTRKGKIVRLESVIDEAVRLSLEHINEKNPDLDNKDEVAKKVGVGAVIFNDLKNYRANDFEFDLKSMVSFTGQTGPYLQYTSVRMASILSDAHDFSYDSDIDPSLFEKKHYHDILKIASQYGKTLKTAAEENAPSVLAKYLLQLASLFNHFYGEEKILVKDKKERNTKLHVLSIVKRILDDGIKLLGMEVIEKM